MRSQELLAVGLFGSGSRLGDRIEMLLRGGRTFSGRISAGRLAGAVLALIACVIGGSLAPRWIAFAQQPAFEVASVKPAAPTNSGPQSRGQIRGGPGTADPERLAIQNTSMLGLLLMAYNIRSYQISGPSWMQNEKYDIQAKVPAGATRAQFYVMLQTLLTERFRMTIRRETKDFDGYDLVVAKGGSKLKIAEPPSAAPAAERGRGPQMGKDGCLLNVSGPCMGGMRFAGQSLAGLVAFIDGYGKPVRDQTGLTGLYEFNLTFDDSNNKPAARAGSPAEAPSDPLPDIFAALQDQLGLKLEPAKIPLDFIVVDHLERAPSDN